MNDTELKSYALQGTTEHILNFMKGINKGIVLDIPSGQGALSKKLENMGFTVYLGDLEGENILYRNRRVAQLNLNHLLPFKDRTFDFVICIEGIEHIENSHHLIRECSRVLKTNGYLLLSTPNVMSIKSRIRFLFYSYLDYFKYYGSIAEESRHKLDDYDHQHINPVFYGEIKYILKKYGFIIEKIEANRKVKKWKILYPFIKWLIKNKTKKRFRKDPFYLSDALLEGEDLLYFARLS
jgi:ubiquinone/menaquinone biosynthesis C-methylase UbiE